MTLGALAGGPTIRLPAATTLPHQCRVEAFRLAAHDRNAEFGHLGASLLPRAPARPNLA